MCRRHFYCFRGKSLARQALLPCMWKETFSTTTSGEIYLQDATLHYCWSQNIPTVVFDFVTSYKDDYQQIIIANTGKKTFPFFSDIASTIRPMCLLPFYSYCNQNTHIKKQKVICYQHPLYRLFEITSCTSTWPGLIYGGPCLWGFFLCPHIPLLSSSCSWFLPQSFRCWCV